MNLEAIKVPGAWRRGTDPSDTCESECFHRALLYIRNCPRSLHAAVWLVHGFYGAESMPHAWIELPGGIVFDGNQQQFYRQRAYYKAVKANPRYKYNRKAALLLHEHLGTDGDWQGEFGLPIAPRRTIRVDGKRAKLWLELRAKEKP